MVRMIDIKSAGLSQDLKELKSNKGFAKALSSQISKIKSEGRAREAKGYEKYNQGMKNRKEVFSQAEKTITNKADYQAYKQKLEQNSKFNPKVERFKANVYAGASKVETGVSVALENVTSKLGRALQKRVISRGIVKKSKATLTLKEKPKDTYVPIYFQAELNNAKRQMFFD
jgi:hypothetical protein